MKQIFFIPKPGWSAPFFILFTLLVATKLPAQQSDYNPGTFVMSTYLVDERGTIPADSVAALQDDFISPSGEAIGEKGSIVWLRTEIVNATDEVHAQHLMYVMAVDSVEVYVPSESGSLQRVYAAPIHDYTPGAGFEPHYTLGVEPGSTFLVYSRLLLLEPATDVDLARVMLFDPSDYTWFYFTVWDAFYTGLVLCMGVLGLLMIYLFRERTFLYFALTMLSWAVYFQFAGLLPDLNGAFPMDYPGFLGIPVGITMLMVSITLFSLNYLKLSEVAPVINRYLHILLVVAVGAFWIPWLGDLPPKQSVYWSNVVLLLFITIGMGMLIRCQLKRVPGANRLHVGLALIVLPTLVQTVQIILDYGVHTYNLLSVQIGSVLFSWLLFSGLYTRVKQMRAEAASISQESAIRSQFFANISHEFRTPLTLILGPLEQLARRHQDDPVDQQLITIAQQNAERQLQLVNRILTLSRLEERGDILQLSRMDLVAKVSKNFESFHYIAEEKDITLDFEAEVKTLPILADIEKLEDILFNLLSNALKFTPPGGRVGVSVSQQGPNARIIVEDNGPGIPADLREFVFNRFSQLPKSPNTEIPGTGIGLSIVRESVLLHGGTIELESAEGQGTTFIIDLPLGETAVETAPIQRQNPEAGNGTAAVDQQRQRILIVEDNSDLRLLIRHLLGGNYEVFEADSGIAGLEIAVRRSPDLIISDVMMPEMDGIELCKELKSRRETSHIPVILLTARSSAAFRIKGLECGADDYLTKPFSDQELLARIQSLLENRKLLRQRYAESIELRPTEVVTTKLDEEFLQTALRIVEEHIDDENFRVAKFAREIGMSSATLNRKLRGLLDQSTNQFIQSIRLQRAADLLATDQYTVGEVAARCGFNSSTYFVRLFKEKHGVTPGNFVRS